MDMLSGVRAFVAVARRGSFSAGADDEQTTQPVVSRRIAALEGRLGGALIERNTRPVTPTPLGAAVLGYAQTLLSAEAALLDAAASHTRGALRLLVPRNAQAPLWAAVRLRASASGFELDIEEDDREHRVLRFRGGEADAAVLPVESARADWIIPLGLAQSTEKQRVSLTSLRPTRAGKGQAPRIVVLPEDGAPSLLAGLRSTAAQHGLAAEQIHEASGVVPALTGALAGDDWILCTEAEARAWRLTWIAVADLPMSRAYQLQTRTTEGAHMLDVHIRQDIGATLGADVGVER